MGTWNESRKRKRSEEQLNITDVFAPAPPVEQPKVGQPTTPPEQNTMPELTDYQQNQQMFEKLMTQPITEEEEQKRIRGAQASQAIGNLGNVLSAFSNLVYTGKGAPSQTLPTVPDPGIQKFEDRVAERRRQYMSGLMGANAKDSQDYYNAVLNYYRGEQNELAKAKQAADVEFKKAQALKYYNENELFLAKLEYQKLLNQGLPAKQAAELAFKEAQTKAQNASAYQRTQQGKNAFKVVDSATGSDGNKWVRNAKLSDNEAKQIVQRYVSDEDLKPFVKTTSKLEPITGEPIVTEVTDWNAAAAWALEGGHVDADELASMGFIRSGNKSGKSKKSNPMSDNGKKKNPMD